jgi:hypothetical protein
MKLGTLRKLLTVLLIVFFSFTFLARSDLLAQKKNDKKVETQKESTDKKDGWRTFDYKPYVKAMDELRKLSDEYAEKNLQLSINEYDKGMDILEDMENEVLKIESSSIRKKHLHERFHWQEIDRKNQQKRLVSRLKYEAKVKAVTNFVKAIKLIDDIENHNKKFITENKNFKIFKVKLYQVYVSTQYDLHNFLPCISVLERYINISEETKNDIWAYKYLASCYGFMESVLAKYKGASEDDILEYKQKKNRSLLKAAQLKYDVNSPQYKHLKDVIERDEMKSEVLSDFR